MIKHLARIFPHWRSPRSAADTEWVLRNCPPWVLFGLSFSFVCFFMLMSVLLVGMFAHPMHAVPSAMSRKESPIPWIWSYRRL